MKKKVLITGISGMLGRAIYKTLNIRSGEYEIYGVSRNHTFQLENALMFYGDLCNDEFVKNITPYAYDIIFHCSAEVNVNICELEREHAYKSNVKGTQNIASLLKYKQLFYISTDSVFDGKIGNYTEVMETNPVNYYAETKLIGERTLNEIRQVGAKYFIIRTNIYGFNNQLKNSLFEWAFKELDKGNKISGYANMYFNPLYVGQLASLLEKMSGLKIESGIYNVGSNSFISKYEFLSKVVDTFKFDGRLLIKEIYENKVGADRPLNTTLNISKIKREMENFDFSLSYGLELLKNDFLQCTNNFKKI